MNFQYGGKDIVLLQYLEERLRKDPASSFFAMLSYFYLEKDRIAEALSIAQRGVIVHPNYSTGHAVLAMAMMRAGFYRDARKELLKSEELHPGSKMIESLKAEVDRQEQADSIGRKIAEQYRKTAGADIMKTVEETLKSNPIKSPDEDLLIPGIDSIVGEEFSGLRPEFVKPAGRPEPSKDESAEGTAAPGKSSTSAREIIDKVAREFEEKQKADLNAPPDAGAVEPEESQEFDLDALARELGTAGPIKPKEGSPRDRDEERGIELTPDIVTDTLAMIFEQQGQYSTAIEAYNILLRKKPDQADFYRKKIAELAARADGKV